MSPQSKREYLAAIVKRYRTASRKIKTVILNEFVQPAGITESMHSGFCVLSGGLFRRLRQSEAESRCMIPRHSSYP